MPAERTLVLVNYFTAALVPRAIASARSASSTPLRVTVVDNSGDPGEAAALRQLDAETLIDAPSNPGYGAAANLGAAGAKGTVIVANSDIEFFPRSIDLLAKELEREGVVASGPRFVWDGAAEWNLPPPDLPTLGSSLGRIAAAVSRHGAERWLRARQRARESFWLLDQPTDQRVLSGAVLCLRADAFHAIRGFDPGYRLYFEEIDLLERLRRRGGRVRYVPSAVCRHLYNQSAGLLSIAGVLYAESERRYYARKFGSAVGAALLRLRRPLAVDAPEDVAELEDDFTLGEGKWLVEASPLPDFSTAAGRFSGPGEVRLPADLRGSLLGSELFLRVIDRSASRPIRAMRLPVNGRRSAPVH